MNLIELGCQSGEIAPNRARADQRESAEQAHLPRR